jgi:hypothetical protein
MGNFFTVVERNANVQVLRWVVRPTMRADSNLELCGGPLLSKLVARRPEASIKGWKEKATGLKLETRSSLRYTEMEYIKTPYILIKDPKVASIIRSKRLQKVRSASIRCVCCPNLPTHHPLQRMRDH